MERHPNRHAREEERAPTTGKDLQRIIKEDRTNNEIPQHKTAKSPARFQPQSRLRQKKELSYKNRRGLNTGHQICVFHRNGVLV